MSFATNTLGIEFSLFCQDVGVTDLELSWILNYLHSKFVLICIVSFIFIIYL